MKYIGLELLNDNPHELFYNSLFIACIMEEIWKRKCECLFTLCKSQFIRSSIQYDLLNLKESQEKFKRNSRESQEKFKRISREIQENLKRNSREILKNLQNLFVNAKNNQNNEGYSLSYSFFRFALLKP